MCTCSQNKVGKVGRPKAKAKRKTASKRKPAAKAAKGPAKRKVINGTSYSHDTCFKTGSAAKRHAADLRKSGNLARVLKNGTSSCVYTAKRRA